MRENRQPAAWKDAVSPGYLYQCAAGADRFGADRHRKNIMAGRFFAGQRESNAGYQGGRQDVPAVYAGGERKLINGFFHHPVISEIMKLADPEAMVDFIAERAKSYDRTIEIVLRFLEGERIRQLPTKGAHRLIVLKYLASKFETGRDYTEGRSTPLSTTGIPSETILY
jgi:hypothetical protein